MGEGGVKNPKKMPTLFMDGPMCMCYIHISGRTFLVCMHQKRSTQYAGTLINDLLFLLICKVEDHLLSTQYHIIQVM